MAKVDVKKRTVEIIDEVVLTLTIEEAIMIRCLTCLVSGDPKTTYRNLSDNIYTALGRAGIGNSSSEMIAYSKDVVAKRRPQ